MNRNKHSICCFSRRSGTSVALEDLYYFPCGRQSRKKMFQNSFALIWYVFLSVHSWYAFVLYMHIRCTSSLLLSFRSFNVHSCVWRCLCACVSRVERPGCTSPHPFYQIEFVLLLSFGLDVCVVSGIMLLQHYSYTMHIGESIIIVVNATQMRISAVEHHSLHCIVDYVSFSFIFFHFVSNLKSWIDLQLFCTRYSAIRKALHSSNCHCVWQRKWKLCGNRHK